MRSSPVLFFGLMLLASPVLGAGAGSPCYLTTDFSRSMAPFGRTNGDVRVSNGRLTMMRTGGSEADAFANIEAVVGPFVLEFDALLMTSASRFSVGLVDGAGQKAVHVVLQNETDNGSEAGLFLFHNSRHGNNPGSETPREDILVRHPFTPTASTRYAVRLERGDDGRLALYLDGRPVGSSGDARVGTIDQVWLNAGQDSGGGHGAAVTTIRLCPAGKSQDSGKLPGIGTGTADLTVVVATTGMLVLSLQPHDLTVTVSGPATRTQVLKDVDPATPSTIVFPDLPTGRYKITAEYAGRKTVKEIDVKSDTLDLDLIIK